jgi:Rft protein
VCSCLPTGLILADSINMVLRIAFSLVYVHSLCGASAGVRLTAFLPRPGTLTALSAAFVITGVICCSGSFRF